MGCTKRAPAHRALLSCMWYLKERGPQGRCQPSDLSTTSPRHGPLWLTDWLLLYVVRRVTLTSPSCHASICHWRWLRHPRTTLCSLTCRSSDALSSSFHFYSHSHAHIPWVGPMSPPNVGPYSLTVRVNQSLVCDYWLGLMFHLFKKIYIHFNLKISKDKTLELCQVHAFCGEWLSWWNGISLFCYHHQEYYDIRDSIFTCHIIIDRK